MSLNWVLGTVAIAALLSAAGCARDVEGLRAELAAKQTVWQREMGAIRAQHAALAERLARRPRVGGAGTTTPAAMRTRAVLDGVTQSLVDLEIQMRQVGPRVEQAMDRSAEAAQKALGEDSARLSGYLQALASDLAAAGRALDRGGNKGTAETAENAADEGA